MYVQEEKIFIQIDKREYLAGPKKGKFFDVEISTSVMFDVEFANK